MGVPLGKENKNEPARALDERDRAILRLLLQNGKAPAAQIAKRIGLSETACKVRIKHLRQHGYFNKYTIDIGVRNSRFKSFAYMLVGLREQNRSAVNEMASFLSLIKNVISLEVIEGEYDFIMKLGFVNDDEFDSVHKAIGSHPLCKLIRTSRCMRLIREHRIDIDHLL